MATHRMSTTAEYYCWQRMKRRCYDPKAKGYKDYGGRGIRVCEEWKDSFERFFSDMGLMPAKGYTIERDDVNGHYCKTNCRWAPQEEQNRNKRNSRKFLYKGVWTNVTVIAREVGLSQSALSYRLEQNGGDVEAAIAQGLPPERQTTVFYKGEWQKTINLTLIAGVPHKVIRERIRRGWTVEKAVETPIDTSSTETEVEWEGQKYPSLLALVKHLGLTYNTVASRLNYYGMSLEEALTKPVKTSGRAKKKHSNN